MFIASPGLSRDILSDDRKIIGSLTLLTDGVFLWPSDLHYYFNFYSVELPHDFIQHIEENAGVFPKDVNIDELEL